MVRLPLGQVRVLPKLLWWSLQARGAPTDNRAMRVLHVGGDVRPAVRRRRLRTPRVLGLVVLLVVSLLGTSSPAQSVEAVEPWCTISWDGGAGTSSWHDAANWNLDRTPTGDYTDRVCVSASAGQVEYSDSWSRLGGLMSDAHLVVAAGRLDFAERGLVELATLDLHGGEVLGGTISTQGDVTWSGGDLGNNERPLWLYVGHPDAPAGSADLHITGGAHFFRGPIYVRGGVDIAEGASVATSYGGMRAGTTVTIAGTVSASHHGVISGDVLVEPTGAVSNVRAGGTWRNQGTFEGEFAPSTGDMAYEGMVNEGTATVWGSTGGAPLENMAGATLTARGTLYVGGSFVNLGLVRVGAGYAESTLEFFHSGSNVLGAIELVRGDVVIGAHDLAWRTTAVGATITGGDNDRYGVYARGNATLSGTWNIGPQARFVLDGDGVELAGAAIAADSVSWNNGGVAAGPASVLDADVWLGARDPAPMRVAAGATLISRQTMQLQRMTRVAGTGTLVNEGVIQAVDPVGYGYQWATFEGRVENNGTITVPAASHRWLGGTPRALEVGALVNAGRLVVGRDAEVEVKGTFEQTATGVLAVVADGDAYDWTQAVPQGDVTSVMAADGVVAGQLEVESVNGCLARAPVVSATAATGALDVITEATKCKYGVGAGTTGLDLVADDTTPPVLPTYDFGLRPGQWGNGAKLAPDAMVPTFSLTPAVGDYWSDAFARDDITDARQVIDWWDTNPTADRSSVTSRLDRWNQEGTRYLEVSGTTGGLWHHVAAQDWTGNWTPVRHEGPFGVDRTRPSAPQVDLDHPADLRHVSGSTFEVTWGPSTDSHSGMASPAYKVSPDSAHLVGGGAPVYTDARSFRLQVRPGAYYCIDVEARDAVSNTARTRGCATAPMDDDAFKATDDWQVRSDPSYYYGDYRVTKKRGASLRRRGVVTKQLWLAASTCADCGSVDVYWNGELRQRVSLVSKVARKKALLPVRAFGSVATGDLMLRVGSTDKTVKIQGVVTAQTACGAGCNP